LVNGTTAGDGEEGVPFPFAFVAVTVKVYESPFVRPVTEHVSGPLDHAHDSLPLDGVVASAAVTV